MMITHSEGVDWIPWDHLIKINANVISELLLALAVDFRASHHSLHSSVMRFSLLYPSKGGGRIRNASEPDPIHG